MPKRGGSSGVAAAAAPAPAPAPVPVPAPAPPPPVFSDTDNADFHDLYAGAQYFSKQDFSQATKDAITDYLNPNPLPGSYYAISQTINHKVRQGIPLTASEANIMKQMNAGMHNLGYNLNLTRYDRVGYLSHMLGLPSNATPDNITKAQLSALVGKTYNDPALVSTSYNKFKNAPSGNCFTDKAVRINIKAPAATQALMPGNGPGGALGEIVLGPSQNYRVTGARVVKERSRSQATYYKHRIEIDVEVY